MAHEGQESGFGSVGLLGPGALGFQVALAGGEHLGGLDVAQAGERREPTAQNRADQGHGQFGARRPRQEHGRQDDAGDRGRPEDHQGGRRAEGVADGVQQQGAPHQGGDEGRAHGRMEPIHDGKRQPGQVAGHGDRKVAQPLASARLALATETPGDDPVDQLQGRNGEAPDEGRRPAERRARRRHQKQGCADPHRSQAMGILCDEIEVGQPWLEHRPQLQNILVALTRSRSGFDNPLTQGDCDRESQGE